MWWMPIAGLKTNGPRGRSAWDVDMTKGLFISQNICGREIRLPPILTKFAKCHFKMLAHLANGQALKVWNHNDWIAECEHYQALIQAI